MNTLFSLVPLTGSESPLPRVFAVNNARAGGVERGTHTPEVINKMNYLSGVPVVPLTDLPRAAFSVPSTQSTPLVPSPPEGRWWAWA